VEIKADTLTLFVSLKKMNGFKGLDNLIVKINQQGTLMWATSVSSTGMDSWEVGVTVDDEDNVWATVTLAGAYGSQNALSAVDQALVKLAPDGTVISEQQNATSTGNSRNNQVVFSSARKALFFNHPTQGKGTMGENNLGIRFAFYS